MITDKKNKKGDEKKSVTIYGKVRVKKYSALILSVIVAVLSLSSCAKPFETNADSGKRPENIKIVTTIFPIYDWVRNITGSDDVICLNGNGSDMHSFEPTVGDIADLSDADVFIYIGGESDAWVENAVKASKNTELVRIALIDKITALDEEIIDGMDAREEEQAVDEHIWLSLKKARECVSLIAETLSEADGTNAEKYKKNADNYNSELEYLDSLYSEAVSDAKRNVLLFADRFPFRYLTEDYNLEYFAAFPGCSAESEASFETMSFLIEKARELSLQYIMVLDGSDGKIAETVSEETGAEILTLNSCQSISKNEIDGGITYYSIMEQNLETLTEALD